MFVIFVTPLFPFAFPLAFYNGVGFPGVAPTCGDGGIVSTSPPFGAAGLLYNCCYSPVPVYEFLVEPAVLLLFIYIPWKPF